jgi:hypothetical protein
MRNDPFAVRKQTGKKTTEVSTAITAKTAGNGTVSSLKYSDTTYYQVGKHGDYIQEQGG